MRLIIDNSIETREYGFDKLDMFVMSNNQIKFYLTQGEDFNKSKMLVEDYRNKIFTIIK